MSETTPKVVGLGGKGYDPKAFHASAGTKVLYSVPKSSDKFFRTPYNNIAGLSPDGVFADYIAPVITGPSGSAGDLITAISINENSTPIHIFSADETVTWNKSGADTSKFTLNTSTGELVFASAPNYEVPTDADGNNIYQVVITATDTAGNASSQTVNVTVSDIDEAPILNSSTPADNATTVALNSNIVLNFNKAVDAESGNIYIKKTSDNSTVQTIDVTSGAVSGSGSATITINPPSDLDSGVEYYVLIDATAFDAADSSSYAGITDATTLSFTTAISHVTSSLAFHVDPNDYSGSGTYDDTVDSVPGTIDGATYDSTNGHYFDFDGTNDEIRWPAGTGSNEVDTSTIFSGSNNFSMSFWVNMDTLPSSGTNNNSCPLLFHNGKRALFFQIGGNGAVNYSAIGLRSHGFGVGWASPVEGDTISTGTWVNMCLTYNTSDGLVLYQNGSSVDTDSATGSISSYTSAGSNLEFFGWKSNDRWTDGKSGPLSIYTKTLTSSEVTQNYNAFKSRYGL